MKAYNAAKTLVLTCGVLLMSGILLLVLFYVMSSPTFGWTGEAQTRGSTPGVLLITFKYL